MRFCATCYRAHDPRWSFKPLSGEGAAIHGGRFNPKGVPALYLSLTLEGAVKEANQGFAFKIDPCVVCCYDVDCEDVVDLRTERQRRDNRITWDDIACPWFSLIAEGEAPPSWALARRLIAQGHAGILVPSFAPRAGETDANLVLWHWGARLPHQVNVYDPSGRLPRNQLSWE